MLEREQKFAEAEQQYREACAAQPNFRLARFNLARMLIAQNKSEEAIAQLDLLRAPEDEETPRYLFALSVAHVRAGHREEGIKWAGEARRLALQFQQTELASAIDRSLATLR
jgi:predicted Zn-dependent protease